MSLNALVSIAGGSACRPGDVHANSMISAGIVGTQLWNIVCFCPAPARPSRRLVSRCGIRRRSDLSMDVTQRARACPTINQRTIMASSSSMLRVASFCHRLFAIACSNPEVEKVRHFERGNQYAAENKDEFAVIEYASAVRLDPMYGEARLKLAETHERMNNLRAAAPEFIRAADALPDNRDAQIKATQILLLAGRFEDAKARATKLLEKDPKDLDALLLNANAMAALKDPAGALAEIEEAMQVNPDDSRSFVSLGALRMQTGEAKEAEAAFRQAIALEPTVSRGASGAGELSVGGRAACRGRAVPQAGAVD